MQKGTGTRKKRVWGRRLVALAVVVGSVAAFAPLASAATI